MTTITLIVCFFLVLIMMPLIIHQIATGSPPTSSGPFRQLQLAQPWLGLAGNLFVLMVCFIALNRLLEHFGLIGPEMGARIDGLLHYPFLALFAVYVGLGIQAAIAVKRRQSA